MKVNVIMLIIAFGIAALAAFGFYSANPDEDYRILITAGSGLTFFITLGGLLAVSLPDGGSLNIKATSILFFIAFLVEHLIFSFTAVGLAPYIVITGILLLLYILISYSITKALGHVWRRFRPEVFSKNGKITL